MRRSLSVNAFAFGRLATRSASVLPLAAVKIAATWAIVKSDGGSSTARSCATVNVFPAGRLATRVASVTPGRNSVVCWLILSVLGVGQVVKMAVQFTSAPTWVWAGGGG